MLNKPNLTAADIQICRETIRNNEARLHAISRRATAISKTVRSMNTAQLEKAANEIADMRKEVADLKRAIRSAKLAIARFYAPASVA
jgi:chromosome segregation ATPase